MAIRPAKTPLAMASPQHTLLRLILRMPRRDVANPEHPQPAVHQGIPDPLDRGLAGGARLPPELGPELLDPLADLALVPGVIPVIHGPCLPPSPVQMLGNCPARPGDACPLQRVEAGVDPMHPFRYSRSRHSTSNVTCPFSSSGMLGMTEILESRSATLVGLRSKTSLD